MSDILLIKTMTIYCSVNNSNVLIQILYCMNFSFSDYQTENFFDEMFTPEGEIRSGYEHLKNKFENLTNEDLTNRQLATERALLSMGITFNV